MALVVQPPRGIAESLGTGLSEGLSLLAQNKLKEISQRNQARGLESLGFNPSESSALASLDPSIQKEFVKQRLAAPSQEAFAQSLSELLGGTAPETGIAALGQPQAPMTATQEATQMKQKPRLTEKQSVQLAKLGLQKQSMAAKERAAINKETKQIYDETIKGEKAAKESSNTLNKMEELIKRGKLPPPALYKLVKDIEEKVPPAHAITAGAAAGLLAGGPAGAAIGGGIGAFINPIASLIESGLKRAYPDAEQFEKLSNSFIRSAKEIFGNRITDLDLKTFLSLIPNLTQTENGKKQIINNIKAVNKAAEVRAKALKDILRENKGQRPENLAILIEDRASDELDKLSKEFITS